ncbi:glycosyltransferase [Ferruginibacter albus]|uniref:glycosyltransferase n=1 Tax=Ferruginibacter albus TaxID=2875540 RepID=UPI001CC6C64B|nr:glycosyltransferase [Ferruginibacter albus]UAY50690.1 glycosyltransferase [Ferruginibacter albus]
MKISVALCTYNGESYLARQLDSVFNQLFPVDQIVICDDGSTDDTINIIKKYQGLHSGIVELYINEHTLGVRKNFEKAISFANGDIIFLADQDDVWPSEKVKEVVSMFKTNPGIKGVFTNGQLIDEDDHAVGVDLWQSFGYNTFFQKLLSNDSLFELMITNGHIVTGAAMAIRNVAKQDILPFQHVPKLWHDEWIAYKLSSMDSLMPCNKNLFYYRIHSKQQIGVYNIENIKKRCEKKERFYLKKIEPEEKIAYILHLYSRLKYAREIIDLFPQKRAVLQNLETEFKKEKRNIIKGFSFFERKLRLFYWFVTKRFEISFKDVCLL